MRGQVNPQSDMLCLISPASRVPQQHPLRQVKALVDEVLHDLSPLFDEMYAELGRPSIPPERLLKAKVLQALYTIRSESLLVEALDYNLLFRWFLDLNLVMGYWGGATKRAVKSTGPPGELGAMMVTALFGNPCAAAPQDTASASTAAQTRARLLLNRPVFRT